MADQLPSPDTQYEEPQVSLEAAPSLENYPPNWADINNKDGFYANFFQSPSNAAIVVALVDAATITTDASLGDIFTVTLGDNRTLGAPTNPVNGKKIIYRVRQDGTGSRTLAYDPVFRFGTDVPQPVLSVSPNKTDYLGFIYNSDNVKWECLAVARGY